MTKFAGSGYGGDISATEAYELLKKDKSSVLVDVRTKAEWAFVGAPDLSPLNKEPVFIEWQEYPSMQVNPQFGERVQALIAALGGDASTPLLFLCRSGARSQAAAIAVTAAGQLKCLNIAGGFEGGHDASRRRGAIQGWKASGLPWAQS